MSQIDFMTTDAQTIAAQIIAQLEQTTGRKLYQGDPVRLIALGIAYVQAGVAMAANDAANQSFLDTARGVSLNALGALLGVVRRPSEAARCTLRFSLGAARASATLIPKGTMATIAGSGIYWATIEAATIPAGDTSIDVIAEASVSGPVANGYLAGEINTLVESLPFVTSVANITASSDGSDSEDDGSLRERIREAPTRFSVAGPEDAYITLTKDARADIESVSIHSPNPREIDIYFTLAGGELPATETIAEVTAYLNDKYRRPMSDVVDAHAPTAVNYTIDLTYYISVNDSARAGEIDDAITQAVADYVAWQKSTIGRDINPSELQRRVMNAGAYRVTITSPVFTELDYSQLAVLQDTATITFGDIVNE